MVQLPEYSLLMAEVCRRANQVNEVGNPTPSMVERLMNHHGFSSTSMVRSEETSTFAIVSSNDDMIVIAFAGSSELYDWLGTNIDARWARFDPRQKPQCEKADLFTVGKVHKGFYDAYQSVEYSLFHVMQSQGPIGSKKVFITGHSLGGAIATVAGRCLYSVVDGVYTYGSPRVFDRKGTQVYDNLLRGKSHRFINRGDFVACLPPAITGYRHVKQTVTFNSGTEHDLQSYIDCIAESDNAV